jgi:hypothetical protein
VQASTSSASASTSSGGNIFKLSKHDWSDALWLIDSRASKHMADSDVDFRNYISYSRNFCVKLLMGQLKILWGEEILCVILI